MQLSFDSSTDSRVQFLMGGRFLCWTNSPSVELLDIEKRFVQPLPNALYAAFYGPKLPVVPTLGFAFVVAATGYLLIEPGYDFYYHQVGEFSGFEYQILGNQNECFPHFSASPKIAKVYLRGPFGQAPHQGWQVAPSFPVASFPNALNVVWAPTNLDFSVSPLGLDLAVFLSQYNPVVLGVYEQPLT